VPRNRAGFSCAPGWSGSTPVVRAACATPATPTNRRVPLVSGLLPRASRPPAPARAPDPTR